MPDPVYTVGHSVRPLADFIDLLRQARVGVLVDVRRYPASRRHPQFGRDALASAVAGHGIAYEHEPDLGGRRQPRRDSPNTAWTQAVFRGYADHMATPEFREALARVQARAAEATVAVMCAEAVPWRCHRQLIADALLAAGHRVMHILGVGGYAQHTLNPAGRLGPDGVLVYRAAEAGQTRLFASRGSAPAGAPAHRRSRRPR
jgi:uncharacterized protein (DUF488 family)